MKRCTKCGFPKPLGAFYKKSASRDGRTAQCRKCLDSATKEYRRLCPKYRETTRAANNAWNKRNPGKVQAARDRYNTKQKAIKNANGVCVGGIVVAVKSAA